jgi:hypothetical protein
MMFGQGRLRHPCDARYPEIRPTSLRDFLRSRASATS